MARPSPQAYVLVYPIYSILVGAGIRSVIKYIQEKRQSNSFSASLLERRKYFGIWIRGRTRNEEPLTVLFLK